MYQHTNLLPRLMTFGCMYVNVYLLEGVGFSLNKLIDFS